MKSSDYFNIGPRLTLAFALLIALILAGNALVIWQFHMARIQTDRLMGANQQLIAVLQFLDHRLLVGRALSQQGIRVSHLLNDGNVVSHIEIEDRLLQMSVAK